MPLWVQIVGMGAGTLALGLLIYLLLELEKHEQPREPWKKKS